MFKVPGVYLKHYDEHCRFWDKALFENGKVDHPLAAKYRELEDQIRVLKERKETKTRTKKINSLERQLSKFEGPFLTRRKQMFVDLGISISQGREYR